MLVLMVFLLGLVFLLLLVYAARGMQHTSRHEVTIRYRSRVGDAGVGGGTRRLTPPPMELASGISSIGIKNHRVAVQEVPSAAEARGELGGVVWRGGRFAEETKVHPSMEGVENQSVVEGGEK